MNKHMTKTEAETAAINSAYEMDRVRESERIFDADSRAAARADFEANYAAIHADDALAIQHDSKSDDAFADAVQGALSQAFSPQRKVTSMAMINPSSGAVKSTPMSSLHSAVSQLREACSGVSSLADQLCGPAPTEVVDKDARDLSGSHFGQIEDCARSVADLAASIDVDLKRIRARL